MKDGMPERFIRILMPPKTGASDEQLYYWRLTMVGALIVVASISAIHMAWTVGALPYFEGEGFVKQEQFSRLAEDTKQARQNTLMVSINDTKRSQCTAKGEYRANLVTQLTAMLVEWEILTGKPFPVPNCEDIGQR